jgi:ankyrin repeat protein
MKRVADEMSHIIVTHYQHQSMASLDNGTTVAPNSPEHQRTPLSTLTDGRHDVTVDESTGPDGTQEEHRDIDTLPDDIGTCADMIRRSKPRPKGWLSSIRSDHFLSTAEKQMWYRLTCQSVRVSELAAFLIGKPKCLHKSDADSLTLLHVCASSGHTALVNLLLESQAAIDARDRYSRTPLHLAFTFNHLDTIELLLQAGASHVTNTATQTTVLHRICVLKPLNDTEMSQCMTLIDRIMAQEAQRTTAEATATTTTSTSDTTTRLIEYANNVGETPLFTAVITGTPLPIITRLLDHSANPNARRSDGASVLECALAYHHDAAGELLLTYGAEKYARLPGCDMVVNVNNVGLHALINENASAMIPTELLVHIFSYLPLADLVVCNLTCRRWRSVLSTHPWLFGHLLGLTSSASVPLLRKVQSLLDVCRSASLVLRVATTCRLPTRSGACI